MNLINNQNNVHSFGGNTSIKKTCGDSDEYMTANTCLSSSAPLPLPGTAQRKIVLTPLSDGSFVTDHNKCNDDSQPHIMVNSAKLEHYLTHSNGKCTPPLENNIDDINHNTKNVSATKRCPSLSNIVQFFFSPFSDMYANGFSGFSWNPTAPQIVGFLVNLYFPSMSDIIWFGEVGFYIYMLGNISPSNATLATEAITINNSEAWIQIGRNNEHPSNGYYMLTNDIDLTIYSDHIIKNFTGHLDGQGYRISHQHSCLMETISGDAIIENLILTDIKSSNITCIPSFAHMVRDNALLKNIQVQYAQINDQLSILHYPFTNNRNYTSVGILAGTLTDDVRIEDARVIDSNIIIYGVSSNVGCLAGSMQGASRISDSVAINCTAKAVSYLFNNVATMVGWMSWLTLIYNNTMIGCTTYGGGKGTNSGIGAGKVTGNSLIVGNTAIGCVSWASGVSGNAGIWKGHQSPNASGDHNIAINSIAKATGEAGRAGIVAAYVSGLSATSPYYYYNDELIVDCRVETIKDEDFVTNGLISNYAYRCQNLIYAGGNFLHNNCTPDRKAIYSYWNMIAPENVTSTLNAWGVPTGTNIDNSIITSNPLLNTTLDSLRNTTLDPLQNTAPAAMSGQYFIFWYLLLMPFTFGLVMYARNCCTAYKKGRRGCELPINPMKNFIHRCNRMFDYFSENRPVPTEDPDDIIWPDEYANERPVPTEDPDDIIWPDEYANESDRRVNAAQRYRKALEAEKTYFSNTYGFDEEENIELNDERYCVSTVDLTCAKDSISLCQDLDVHSDSAKTDRRLRHQKSNVHIVTLHNLDKWSPIL